MIKRWLQEGSPRQRITELEAQVTQLTAERDAQAQYIVDLLAENGDLHKQLDKAQTREKAAAEQRKLVQEHLDVLSPKSKRTSRAKPPAKEENNG